jgi:hypothetical protein
MGHLPLEEVEGIHGLPSYGDLLVPLPEDDLFDLARVIDLRYVHGYLPEKIV